MDFVSPSVRLQMLREEIKLILDQERLDQRTSDRSDVERASHSSRMSRLLRIRKELRQMQNLGDSRVIS